MTFARHRWTSLKTLVAIVAVVLVWGLLPVGFKGCMRRSLVKVQAPVWSALRDASDLQDTAALKLASKDELVAMISELGREQAGLELKLKSATAAEAQKARLEALLKMPPYWGYDVRVGRVIRRDLTGWWQQLWIDRGSSSGIRPGMGVVCAQGVVGRISEVYEKVAVVELLTSERFRMASMFDTDVRPFVYVGESLKFGTAPIGLAQAMQPQTKLLESETREVVTTGLSGSFPEGLPIGTLFKTDGQSAGGLLEGQIRLAAPLESLTEVSVLLPNR
jgi:rod shape-determining protein MreC